MRFISFGYFTAFISTFGQTFYIAMYSGELRSSFNLSHGEFANIYAAGTLSSGFLLIWLGKLIDRMDLRLYSVCLCLGMAGACFTMSIAQDVLMLILAIFLLRIVGQGLLSQAATVTMARYFGEFSRGRAVSLAALGFPSGQAIFPAMSVFALLFLTWRDVWLISACILMILVPPLLIWLLKGHSARQTDFIQRTSRSPKNTSEMGGVQWTRSQVLRDIRFFLSMMAMMSTAFVITGLNFHQVHLTDVKGWDLSFYASCFSIYAMSQVGMSVITGMLIDRYGAVSLTPFYMLPMVCSTFVIGFFDSSLTIVLFMALAGITGGATATIISTIWAELYGVLHLGSIKAMVAGIQVIASALGPPVFGWLIDYGVGIENISIVCGFYSLLGCLLLAGLFRPRLLAFWRL
ncbi:MAG: MFS transporter [Rhodospirillaceae bacterium]|nr:MFS transporter [Rhodospirillaceae bacterium]|tara:strand:- start:123 stop:1337 length:1215 start_codon:yes stop_codon:yes gene_type:complete